LRIRDAGWRHRDQNGDAAHGLMPLTSALDLIAGLP
jgi:hypothetical protein